MEIKIIKSEYKDSVKEIINYCFEMPKDMLEAFLDEGFNFDDCLGCFDGEKLAALIYISSHQMYFCKKTVPMAGIGFVSTLPQYRRSHYASELLINSLGILKERGYIFSALAPFSYSFYRKYGWELGFHKKVYSIPIENLKGIGRGEGEFRPLASRDIDNIIKVYEGFFSKYNGAVKRDKNDWEKRIEKLGKDRSFGYAYSRQGNGLGGYILYTLKDRVFSIKEMAYDSLSAKEEILRFVYYHSAQVKKVVWTVPQDDNTPLLLDDPEIEQKIEPGMMIRVIDVRKALEAHSYPILYKGSFTIRVEDKWAPWNNETIRVTIGQGSAVIQSAGDTPPDLECDIQTFSQIISGYIGTREALGLGKIYARNQEILEDMEIIFRNHVTHMTEYF